MRELSEGLFMSYGSIVMVRCPTTEENFQPVEMDAATFERLPDIHSQVKCPFLPLGSQLVNARSLARQSSPFSPTLPWLFINNQQRAND